MAFGNLTSAGRTRTFRRGNHFDLGPILPSATTPGVFIAQNRTVFRADSSGGLTWAVVEQPVRFSGLPPGTLGGFPYALPPLPPRASSGQG